LRGILFVARKYTNESYLSVSVDNQHDKQREYNISKVKVPYFFKVTYRVKCSEDLEGNPLYAETDIISKKPFPKELDIVKNEPVEIIFLNKCPKCGKEGRPRVDKKNVEHYDYPKYASNVKEQYRLIYNHKQEDKKVKSCVIAKFDEKHGMFTKTGKISKRVEDYIFPNYLTKNVNL